VHKIEELE